MILIALFIGIVIIIAALRNSQGALFSALGEDVPGYIVWGAALFAVGALGYVPGLKPVSRGLLALVIIVIILNNYQNILNGFQQVASGATATGSATSQPGGSQSAGETTGSTSGNAASTDTQSSNPLGNPPTVLETLLTQTPDLSSAFGGSLG